MMDYYEILGIKKDATDVEIKSAFRKNMKYYHPDVNDSSNAENMSKALIDAREVLLDTTKRKEYDEQLDRINNMEKNKYTKNYEEYKNTYSSYKKEYSEQYVFVNKEEAIRYWLKNTKLGIIRKILVLLLIATLWILFRIIQLLETPILLVNIFFNFISSYWASIWTIIVFILFVFEGDILANVTNIFAKIFMYILLFLIIYVPVLFSEMIFDCLPKMMMKIHDFENFILGKILSF